MVLSPPACADTSRSCGAAFAESWSCVDRVVHGAAGKPLRADEADDQFAVAAGHYDHGQWKLAVEEFRTFRQDIPTTAGQNVCVFFLGEALLQLGKFDEARRQFHEYASREPEGKYARAALFRSGEAAYLAGESRRGQARSRTLPGEVSRRSAGMSLRAALPGRHRPGPAATRRRPPATSATA